MQGRGGGPEAVLLVEDDPGLRELYAHHVGRRYEVRTARTIAEALDACDDDIGVVVLDRLLPDGDGLDAVGRVRERAPNAFVVAVTGVDPGLDVVDSGLDDYLTKPVDAAALVEAVDALDERRTYERDVARYYALASRRAALEAAHDAAELAGDDRYESLLDELTALGSSIGPTPAVLDEPQRASALYRDIAADVAN